MKRFLSKKGAADLAAMFFIVFIGFGGSAGAIIIAAIKGLLDK